MKDIFSVFGSMSAFHVLHKAGSWLEDTLQPSHTLLKTIYSLSVESVEWEQTAMEMLTSTFISIVIHVPLQYVQDHQ